MAYIYKLTNKYGNKSYIGFTRLTPSKRFETHIMNAKIGVKGYLYNAIRKYGKESFVLETIEESPNADFLLHEREPYFIKYFDTYENGYNMTFGGDGITGYRCSDATKLKHSVALKGRKYSKEHCLAISKAKLGIKRPEISDTARHNAIGNTHRAKIFKIKTPQGEIREIFNLSKFCSVNKISQGTLTARKHTKGFELVKTNA